MSYPDPVELLLLSMPELKADLEDRLQKGYSQTYESASCLVPECDGLD